MKLRVMLSLAFVGAVAFAAAAWGDHAVPGAKDRPTLRTERAEQKDERRADRRHHWGRFGRRLVHGEFKVQTDDGFATVVVDTGEVTAVDAGAGTLTIRRADDETVTVTVNDDTRIGKDGHRADLGDIEVGDRARVVRRDDGEGLRVARIMAHGPEPEAERDAA